MTNDQFEMVLPQYYKFIGGSENKYNNLTLTLILECNEEIVIKLPNWELTKVIPKVIAIDNIVSVIFQKTHKLCYFPYLNESCKNNVDKGDEK